MSIVTVGQLKKFLETIDNDEMIVVIEDTAYGYQEHENRDWFTCNDFVITDLAEGLEALKLRADHRAFDYPPTARR